MESRQTSRKGRTLGPGHRIQRGQISNFAARDSHNNGRGTANRRSSRIVRAVTQPRSVRPLDSPANLSTLTASDFCSRRHESETDGDHGPPRRRRARPDPTDDVRDSEAPRARPRAPPGRAKAAAGPAHAVAGAGEGRRPRAAPLAAPGPHLPRAERGLAAPVVPPARPPRQKLPSRHSSRRHRAAGSASGPGRTPSRPPGRSASTS